MQGSLIPANTKRSTLILGMYRLVPDIVILATGVVITTVALFAANGAGTLIMILACIPVLTAALLTAPLPNYHNVLCVIQSILRFYNERRKYIWRGWCAKNEYEDGKQ